MREQKKNQKNSADQDSLAHLDMDTVNAGSSTDCTGLIPSAPQSRADREAYKELYDFEAGIRGGDSDGQRPEKPGGKKIR